MPLFWGITADGCVAFSDDIDMLKGSCGKSLAPFPQGIYLVVVVVVKLALARNCVSVSVLCPLPPTSHLHRPHSLHSALVV